MAWRRERAGLVSLSAVRNLTAPFGSFDNGDTGTIICGTGSNFFMGTRFTAPVTGFLWTTRLETTTSEGHTWDFQLYADSGGSPTGGEIGLVKSIALPGIAIHTVDHTDETSAMTQGLDYWYIWDNNGVGTSRFAEVNIGGVAGTSRAATIAALGTFSARPIKLELIMSFFT